MTSAFYLLFSFFPFLLGCLLLIPINGFYVFVRRLRKHHAENKTWTGKNTNQQQQQRPNTNAVQTPSNIHTPNIVIWLKNTISMMSMLMTTQCAMAIGKWFCAPHNPICEARRALPLLVRRHYSIDFNGIYAQIRNLFNSDVSPSMRWIGIRCTGARGQHKRRDDAEKRSEKGLVWALPCVLIDCIIIKKLSVCDNSGREKRKPTKEMNCVQGSSANEWDLSNRHKSCNYLPKFTPNGSPILRWVFHFCRTTS